LFEIETQLLIANDLGFITNQSLYAEILNQIEEESKMINAFSKTLKD
jgi:four helix bundle protein